MINNEKVEQLEQRIKELEEELAEKRKEYETTLDCVGRSEFLRALDNEELEFCIIDSSHYGISFAAQGDDYGLKKLKIEGIEFLYCYGEDIYCGDRYLTSYWFTPVNLKSIKFFNTYDINVIISENFYKLIHLAKFVTYAEDLDDGNVELVLGKDI